MNIIYYLFYIELYLNYFIIIIKIIFIIINY